MISVGITDHLEGLREESSSQIYGEVSDLVRIADEHGAKHAWFTEHHAHAHYGHLPSPLLLALHLAGQTKRIQLGTAIICLNLHHALDVAEQVAVADLLSDGRMAPGFGSGSTPEEFALFGLRETEEAERHRLFEEKLRFILDAWKGANGALPIAPADLRQRSWLAVNSVGAAKIAGTLNFNMLFSHLRTPEQYREYSRVYRDAGGTLKIAANRPVFVARTEKEAQLQIEPALRKLWRRFQKEGKIAAEKKEPQAISELAAHPINFIIGSPRSVADQILALHRDVPFDVINIEVRWAGLAHALVKSSLELMLTEVAPLLR